MWGGGGEGGGASDKPSSIVNLIFKCVFFLTDA